MCRPMGKAPLAHLPPFPRRLLQDFVSMPNLGLHPHDEAMLSTPGR